MTTQKKYLRVEEYGFPRASKRLIPITGAFFLNTALPPAKGIILQFPGTTTGTISKVSFFQVEPETTPYDDAIIILKNSIIDLLSNGESILDIDLISQVEVRWNY